ncbi:MAG: hypothetical protein IIA66_07040 [Planctomycetes bacterium]|nr:hypothetical protein [Planctomycetota bacterium]
MGIAHQLKRRPPSEHGGPCPPYELKITRNPVYISKTSMIQRLRQTVEHIEQDEE